MNPKFADLLIGGSRFRQIPCELSQEKRCESSEDWLLSGRMSLPELAPDTIETSRQYLLRLDDGRQGLIELVSLVSIDHHVEADFRPSAKKPR